MKINTDDSPVLNRKQLKSAARINIKKNYVAYLAVCFLMVFFAGQYGGTTLFISSFNKENVTDIRYGGDFKRDVVEDIKDNNLTSQYVSEKYAINDVPAIDRWVKIYNAKGPEALNSREISLFNLSEESNWDIIKKTTLWFAGVRNELPITKIESQNITRIKHGSSDIFDSFTKQHTSKFLLANAFMEIAEHKSGMEIAVSFGSAIFAIIVTLLINNTLIVGERRFFLESRTYHKTKIGCMGFMFRDRSFKPVKVMFWKDFYLGLWTFTIAGLVVKSFEYMMIPFILAENPTIERSHAFKLSKQMMHKNKWFAAKLILSFWYWYAAAIGLGILISWLFMSCFPFLHVNMLASIFMGVLCIVFINPYITATKTEFYIKLRKKAITQKYEFYEDLCDKYLDLDLLQEQKIEDNSIDTTEVIIIPDS